MWLTCFLHLCLILLISEKLRETVLIAEAVLLKKKNLNGEGLGFRELSFGSLEGSFLSHR